MVIVCLYCFFVTIISTLISLVVERNTNAWIIYLDIRLIAILYSVILTTKHTFIFFLTRIYKKVKLVHENMTSLCYFMIGCVNDSLILSQIHLIDWVDLKYMY